MEKATTKTILMDFLVRKLGNPAFMAEVVIDSYLKEPETDELLKTIENGPKISDTKA